MKFYSYQNCKKLLELGCESRSYFYYNSLGDLKPFSDAVYNTPAFTNLDFLDTTETARENCKKRWPDETQDGTVSFKYRNNDPKRTWVTHSEYHRHKMSDSPDGEEYVMENL